VFLPKRIQTCTRYIFAIETKSAAGKKKLQLKRENIKTKKAKNG